MRILDYPADLEQVEKTIRDLGNDLQRSINASLLLYKGYALHTDVSLSYDDTVNAHACEDPGAGIREIVIHLGFFRELEAYYKTVLYEDNSRFFQTISLGELYDKAKSVRYFRLFMTLSLAVILFHEFGHIYNGHILYGNKVGYFHRLAFNRPDENKEDMRRIKTIQAMEWNADDFAATRMIARYVHAAVIREVNGRLLCPLIKNIDHMLFLVMWASGTAFAIMGMGQKRGGTGQIYLDRHLPLRFRAKQIIDTEALASHQLNQTAILPENDLILYRAEQWVNLYKIQAEGHENDSWNNGNNLHELEEVNQSYYREVENYLHVLRTVLIPYSRLNP